MTKRINCDEFAEQYSAMASDMDAGGDLDQRDQAIRKEADELLGPKGLRSLLEDNGTPHVTGSYALHLMTWRDLDIYLEAPNLSEESFFRLGGRIASCLAPVRMSFRNERINRTPNLPLGLYWGVYLGDERKGAWKIDIWAVGTQECKRQLDFNQRLAAALTSSFRSKILSIKQACWKDPGYRKTYTSQDIYRAVMEQGIEDVDSFKDHMKGKGVCVD